MIENTCARSRARVWLDRAIRPACLIAVVMVISQFTGAQTCGTAGKDGSPGTITGVVNTYYAGTASAAVGATSIQVGASTGAATAISSGDLLLVIQMQGASISTSNNNQYGDNVNGDPGSGYTNANGAGRYEFVKAMSAVVSGAVTIKGGGGVGLLNAYTTGGQSRFQVVRVPQYGSVTLGSTLTALAWNGSTGGILALDVQDNVGLNNSTVSVTGLGFRGGGGRRIVGGGGVTTDYRNNSTNILHGSKGEGIAGTPRWLHVEPTNTIFDNGVEGYANGSTARGAPATAGGGGTDNNPANGENSGGGGGGNGGAGGLGGNTWSSNLVKGGFGGVAFAERAAGRIVMGGGGGAGSRENDTTVGASSGAAGGGIVIIRARQLQGAGTITADGAAAYNNTMNDGGGGGGAGGSVVVFAVNGSPSGLTVNARGGRGGDAWHSQAQGSGGINRHGPGGGGGGGVVFLYRAGASIVVTAGANGITTTANDAYGAAAGSNGVSATNITGAQIPGVSSGAECISAPTAVEAISFSATNHADGVTLRWETGEEVNNLGFNIYREEADKRLRLNKSLVVGSGLMATPGTRMTAGHSYAWRTGVAQTEDAVYWIEEIDFSGRTVWHGPVYSQASRDGQTLARAEEIPTVTLADLNQDAPESGMTAPVMNESRPATTVSGLKVAAATVGDQGARLSSQAAVKISIKQEGWYRVTQPELVAAGLRPNADPRSLQLFVDGQEVPISVLSNNGNFDSTGAIEFYGLGLDTPSSDRHVYWLVEGVQGKRIATAKGNSGLPAAASFLQTVERRDRTIYVSGIHNGDAENFFGSVVGSATTDQAITLQHVDSAVTKQATIEVGMQGLSLTPHVVTVNLNGLPLGAISYDQQANGVAQFTVPNDLLTEGQNHLTLSGQQGLDLSLVDHIRVSYWRKYAADGNALSFTASGDQRAAIGGFTSGDIKVVDTTLPGEVAFVSGEVTQEGSGYTVTLAAPGKGVRTLFAFGADQARSALAVVANVPSSLKTPSNEADLVIIAHAGIKDSLAPLAALRQSQGSRVATVDVEDIYDEFNYGNKSAQAVKDFLFYAATNWRKAPRYVLLAGGASYDPKNYNGLGDYDLTPTKLIDTSFSETASDDWFVDFNNDGVAELAIGRLPAHTAQEAAAMVSKLQAYESSKSQDSALLVSDENLDFDFEAASAQLAGLLPRGVAVTQINRGQIGTAAAKQQLLDGIASGQKIVNYAGHGSPSIWRDNLLTPADAMALQNAGRYPVFVTMTCLNGEFQHPQLNPLSVALMNAPQGGAVAVWASSGFTSPREQATLNQQFYTLLFPAGIKGGGKTIAGEGLTLGEATMKAKSSVSDADIRRTWILFGDPSMKLK